MFLYTHPAKKTDKTDKTLLMPKKPEHRTIRIIKKIERAGPMSNSIHHELIPLLRKHKASRVFTNRQLLDLIGYEANPEQCHQPNTFAEPAEGKTNKQVEAERRLLETLRATGRSHIADDLKKHQLLLSVERLQARHPAEVETILQAIPKAVEQQRSETSQLIRREMHSLAMMYPSAGLRETAKYIFEQLHGRTPLKLPKEIKQQDKLSDERKEQINQDRRELQRVEREFLRHSERGPIDPFATQRRKNRRKSS